MQRIDGAALRPEPFFELQCLGAEFGDDGSQTRDLGLAWFPSSLPVAQRLERTLARLLLQLIELAGSNLVPAAYLADGLSSFPRFVQDLQLLFGGPPPPTVGAHPQPPVSSSLPPLSETGKGQTLT